MWQFINEDMMRSMYPRSRINYTTQARVDDDNFTPAQANSICFKGPRDDGHWVYVDHNQVGHSTYEDELILPADDGMCHGAAMVNAFEKSRHFRQNFSLITKPKNRQQLKQNYKTLLFYYMMLITSGKWDQALRENFDSEVNWIHHDYGYGVVETTSQSLQSYKKLSKEYIRLGLI
jgi:hypothetical protein